MQASHSLSLDRPWLEKSLKAKSRVKAGLGYDADRGDAASSDDEVDPVPVGRVELSPENRRDLSRFLVHGIHHHVHVPCSLGHGGTDLMHKCSSWVHQVGLEIGRLTFPLVAT
jgi:hypothetical protein